MNHNSNPYEAIKYSPDLNFCQIFNNVGDSIRVFIPIDDVKLDSPALKENKVYGSGPYSINSDILAIIAYMGILFPRTYDDKKYWKTSSVCFSPEKEDDIQKDVQIKIVNDEFGLLGVIATVVADEPQSYYKSSQRYDIKSQEEENNGAPFSINIIKASLAMSCEQPIIVDDYKKIVRRYLKPVNIKYDDRFPYIREYFTIQTCRFLFSQYDAIFFTDQGNLVLSGEDSSQLHLFSLNENNETKLLGDLKIDNVYFDDTSITFSNFGTFNVSYFAIPLKKNK